MRAAFLMAGLLFAAMDEAAAQPVSIVLQEPNAQPSDPYAYRGLAPDRDSHAHETLKLGPFSMDIENGTGRDGRSLRFAHVHLDDRHVLGGDVSGTFDGRAATVRLSWPTGF